MFWTRIPDQGKLAVWFFHLCETFATMGKLLRVEYRGAAYHVIHLDFNWGWCIVHNLSKLLLAPG
jgi:hypothetical protein